MIVHQRTYSVRINSDKLSCFNCVYKKKLDKTAAVLYLTRSMERVWLTFHAWQSKNPNHLQSTKRALASMSFLIAEMLPPKYLLNAIRNCTNDLRIFCTH